MKTFSVLINCYGNFPKYSLRALTSILSNPNQRTYDIHVGCCECCREVTTMVGQWLRTKAIDTGIISTHNINKDPMMRLLIDLSDSEYVLWMDDDSYFCSGDWAEKIEHFINEKKPFDCAGHIFYMGKSDGYKRFLRKRPWWKGDEFWAEPDHENKTWFATGGLWIARTEFLRKHNFPDRKMVKRSDDTLLGDLISQHHGKLIDFTPEVMDVIKIDAGNRRGEGEDDQAWER